MKTKIEVRSFLVAEWVSEEEKLRQLEEGIAKFSGRVVSVTEQHGNTYCRVHVYLEVEVPDPTDGRRVK